MAIFIAQLRISVDHLGVYMYTTSFFKKMSQLGERKGIIMLQKMLLLVHIFE